MQNGLGIARKERSEIRLTIVVATYNCADTLQVCLDSIAEQTYPKIELIVVDGGSTDGTLDVIKANQSLITRWISEPDKGIYDAWNKALSMATGDWVYFIGADDKLHGPDSVARVIERIYCLPEDVLVAYGRVQVTKVNGQVLTYGEAWNKVCEKMKTQMSLPHQGVFHSVRLFDAFGGFDASLSVSGDYKLIMQSLGYAEPVFIDGVVVCDQYAGGKSALRKNRVLALEEMRRVQAELKIGMTAMWLLAYFKGVFWLALSRFIDVRA